MNENEKTADVAEELDNAPPGADEEAAETAETSAEEANDNEGGEEPAEEESPAEDKNEGSEDGEEFADDDYDEYDGFYRDASDFEDVDDNTSDDDDESDEDTDEPDDESGDTPSDPEDEDGDEGENEVSEEGEEEEPAEEPEAEETPAEGGEASYSSWEEEDRAAIIKAHPELEKLLKDKPLGEILDDVDLFVYMRGSPAARAKYSAADAFDKAAAKFLAKRAAAPRAKADSKAHLTAGKGKAAAAPVKLPPEIRAQKHLYPGKTDAEILALYKQFSN